MQPSDYPINSVWVNQEFSIIGIVKELRPLNMKLSIYYVKDNVYQDNVYFNYNYMNGWNRIDNE